jgi:hypothetical protein
MQHEHQNKNGHGHGNRQGHRHGHRKRTATDMNTDTPTPMDMDTNTDNILYCISSAYGTDLKKRDNVILIKSKVMSQHYHGDVEIHSGALVTSTRALEAYSGA